VGDKKVGQSLDRAIRTVEDDGLEEALREQTAQMWSEVEEKFKVVRAAKRRL